MKKIIIISIIAAVAVFFSVLIFLIYKIDKKRQETAQRIQEMPDFQFYDTDSLVVRKKDLNSKATLLIYFNSECIFCRDEAKILKENEAALAHVNVLLVSSESLSAVSTFKTTFHLDNKPFRVLRCEDETFRQLFGTNSVPVLFIYNSENQLVKKYRGEVKFAAIAKHL